MPRRKQPAYGMEECGMVEDCGGTPVFAVVLQICWIMRKSHVQSAIVSDKGLHSVLAEKKCAGSVLLMFGMSDCGCGWGTLPWVKVATTLSTTEQLPDTREQERM